MIDKNLLELIGNVQKPFRYIGGERNCIRKDWGKTPFHFALLFPEPYELGLSNLGMSVLYQLINREDDCLAERAYLPWDDFALSLKNKGMPLFSLESNKGLREFDIIGISIQSEVSYTNILYALDLSGIPLLSSERDSSHPIIIGGGPCTLNPLPLLPFFDAFAMGDGEITVPVIIDCLRKVNDKKGRLECLNESPYFLIPSIDKSKRVRLAVVDSLKKEDVLLKPIVPVTEITHDRLNIEIMRGCLRGCRFCQAGFINRPVRERDADDILYLIEQGIKSSGWEDLALTSLSSTDHSEFINLLHSLVPYCVSNRISISLPSMRGDNFDMQVLLSIMQGRRSGLTFAPEAGTERLRRVINKSIRDSDIIRVADLAMKNNWKSIKLYFMIGLPTETFQDIEGISGIANEITYMAKRHNATLHINLGIFIPKPHTPFEWLEFPSREIIEGKILYLKDNLPKQAVKIKFPDYREALIEAVLTRGTEKVSNLLLSAYRKGDHLTGWGEFFDFERWEEACRDNNLSWDDLRRGYAIDGDLPWDFVDTGISKDFLRKEYNKALNEELTYSCRDKECNNCGVCSQGIANRFSSKPTGSIKVEGASFGRGKIRINQNLQSPVYRIHYKRDEQSRFASHLDMGRLFDRLFRQFNIPVEFSEGFSPRPRFSFAPPLPLGLTSIAEYIDFKAKREIPLPILLGMLQGLNIPGVHFLKTGLLRKTAPALTRMIEYTSYSLNLKDLDNDIRLELTKRLPLLRDKDSKVERTNPLGKVKTIMLKDSMQSYEIKGDYFLFSIKSNELKYLNPMHLIEFLTGKKTIQIEKTSVYPDPFGKDYIIESTP